MKEKLLELLNIELNEVETSKNEGEYSSVQRNQDRMMGMIDMAHLMNLITDEEYTSLFNKIQKATFC